MKFQRSLLVASLVAAMSVAACGNKEDTTKDERAAAQANAAVDQAASAAEMAGKAAATAASAAA